MRLLGVSVLGFFLGCWLLFLLATAGLVPLAGRLPLGLYLYFSAASALGWAAGTVFTQLSRQLEGSRRRLFFQTFSAPPGLLFLLRAMAPVAAQAAAPLVPLYALGVFGILFAVPVSLRDFGRR